MKSLILVMCFAVLAASCGQAGVSKGATYFDGLDDTVVAEVLANPVARAKIDEEPGPTRASMAQGIVRNFAVCRDAYHAYRQWITTGQATTLAPLPVPDNPIEPSNAAEEADYARFQAAIDSGEPQKLQRSLTASGSCGQWIPARAGDVSGPTIQEAVEAGGVTS